MNAISSLSSRKGDFTRPHSPQACLLALSDERDMWERAVHDAEVRGYENGRRDMEDEYAQGYADGVDAVKAHVYATQHDLVEAVHRALVRWGGLRENFSRARGSDWPGLLTEDFSPAPQEDHPGQRAA